jgi:hypothetical protein
VLCAAAQILRRTEAGGLVRLCDRGDEAELASEEAETISKFSAAPLPRIYNMASKRPAEEPVGVQT